MSLQPGGKPARITTRRPQPRTWRERAARLWAKVLGRPYRPGGNRRMFASQRSR